MHYLSPAPDATSLAQLYTQGAVDPVYLDPGQVKPIPRIPQSRSPIRAAIRFLNGWLRGHPHDWPDEDGHGRSILDFGCHDGTKLIYWYQRGWRVAGIDLNEKAIAVAKQRFPDGLFWCGDLLELKITERFDCIRTDNVVEHLLDPIAYLSALARLLKPGGYLRVFVPNGLSLSTKIFGRYSYVYWMPFHLNLFSPNTLMLALEKAGMTEIRCETFAPIGSWAQTQRQLLSRPGFAHQKRSRIERILQYLSLLNYPGETLTQWLGMGDEVVATGRL